MLIFNWEGNLNTNKYLESLGIYIAFYKYVCFMQYLFFIPFISWYWVSRGASTIGKVEMSATGDINEISTKETMCQQKELDLREDKCSRQIFSHIN